METRWDSGLDCSLEVEGGKPIEIRWNFTNSTHFAGISGEIPAKWAEVVWLPGGSGRAQRESVEIPPTRPILWESRGDAHKPSGVAGILGWSACWKRKAGNQLKSVGTPPTRPILRESRWEIPATWADLFGFLGFRSDPVGIRWNPANSIHFAGISGRPPQSKWSCWVSGLDCLLEAEGGKPIEIRWSPTNSTHFAGISGVTPAN